MQQPPPGPPPQSNPPAMTSSGVDKRTGATLSYLFWWITGIIFLFVGKSDPDVRFHAAQSIVFFGGITVLRVILGIIAIYVDFVGWISLLVFLIGLVYWLIAMYKAWTGNGARFDLPIVGSFITPYADQLANSVK